METAVLDGRMVQVIALAAAAGRNRAWSRKDPRTAAGLLRKAERLRLETSAMLGEIYPTPRARNGI